MSLPSNPPAYPSVESGGPNQDWPVHHHGMSLRDYYAGQALAGFMANTRRPTTIAPDDATWCYAIADAMLVAREQAA